MSMSFSVVLVASDISHLACAYMCMMIDRSAWALSRRKKLRDSFSNWLFFILVAELTTIRGSEQKEGRALTTIRGSVQKEAVH